MNFENKQNDQETISIKAEVGEKAYSGQLTEIVNNQKDLAEQALAQMNDQDKIDDVRKSMPKAEDTPVAYEAPLEMPNTPSGKRLQENLKINGQELQALKAEFSSLSSAEAYNKFQTLTLKKTADLLLNKIDGLESIQVLDPRNKADMDKMRQYSDDVRKAYAVLNKLKMAIASASRPEAKTRAMASYSQIMRENINKGTDGYDLINLKKVYKAGEYDSSLFNSDKIFDSFQEDLADNILSDEQATDFKKMQSAAAKQYGSKDRGRSGVLSAGQQTENYSSVFSNVSAEDLAK